MALAGLDAAVRVLEKRQARSRGGPQEQETGQPVYGMPGRTFDPQGGFR